MNLPLVVSPEQISQTKPAGLKIVDLRPLEAFAEAHIAGALHLDVSVLNRAEAPIGGLLPDATAANLLAKTIGLQAGDHVVAYDQGAGTAAARLIWVLHAYGFHATSWLNGGFNAWTEAGLSVSTDAPTSNAGSTGNAAGDGSAIDQSIVQLQHTPGNIISVDALMAELSDENMRILDVRSAAEFNGTDVRTVRGGHVPKALHSEWTQAFDESGKLKSDAELRDLFVPLGIETGHHVVVYCQTHQRSALTYVVLKHLQYQQVSAIDGAWSAWGNRADTPIEV